MDNISFKSFAQINEWVLIVRHLGEVKKAYQDQMIDAAMDGDVPRVMALGGKCSMIDEVLGLPEFLSSLHGGTKDATNKEG